MVIELERNFMVMGYIVCITKESIKILKKYILISVNLEAIKYRQVASNFFSNENRHSLQVNATAGNAAV